LINQEEEEEKKNTTARFYSKFNTINSFQMLTQMHNVGGQLIAHNCKHQFSIPINGLSASLVE
jgi:hypothetical protein